MFFGLDMEKLILLGLLAVLLLGPERLPRYAEALARLTVRAREWLNGAKSRVKEEMGDDFDDIEWRKLDPRQYDPRRFIRDALLDDAPVRPVAATNVLHPAPSGLGGARRPIVERTASPDDPPATVPFDSEAT